MSKDKTEERKEKVKPTKLFSITAFVYDDGVIAGTCTEIRDLGRMKAQKLIVPDSKDFIDSIRSVIPSAVPAITELVEFIFNDIGCTDLDGSEKIAKTTVDIYSDGYIDCDFAEIVKGTRGAPKAWRLTPKDFFKSIENSVGNLTKPFKLLSSNSNITSTTINSTTLDDIYEHEDENTDTTTVTYMSEESMMDNEQDEPEDYEDEVNDA